MQLCGIQEALRKDRADYQDMKVQKESNKMLTLKNVAQYKDIKLTDCSV